MRGARASIAPTCQYLRRRAACPGAPRTVRSRGSTYSVSLGTFYLLPSTLAPQAFTLELHYHVGKRKGVLLSLTTTPGALLDAATAGHDLMLLQQDALPTGPVVPAATRPVVTTPPSDTQAAAAAHVQRSAASPAQASGTGVPAAVAPSAAGPRLRAQKGLRRFVLGAKQANGRSDTPSHAGTPLQSAETCAHPRI